MGVSLCVCAAATNERQPQIAAVFSLHFPIVSQNGVRQHLTPPPLQTSPHPQPLSPYLLLGVWAACVWRVGVSLCSTHLSYLHNWNENSYPAGRSRRRVRGYLRCVGLLNQPHHYHYHYQRSGGCSWAKGGGNSGSGSFVCTANPQWSEMQHRAGCRLARGTKSTAHTSPARRIPCFSHSLIPTSNCTSSWQFLICTHTRNTQQSQQENGAEVILLQAWFPSL